MLTVIAALTLLLLAEPISFDPVVARSHSFAIFTKDPTIEVDAENGASDGVGGTLHTTLSDQGGTLSNSNGGTNLGPGGLSSEAQITISPTAGLGQIQLDAWCGWSDVVEPPAAGDPIWAGNNPSAGTLRYRSCPVLLPGTPGAPGNLEGRPVEYQFAPNGATATPPPPNPATLAQQAISQLQVPLPAIGVGPDRGKLAVNLWTWLWVDNPGPLSSTVSLSGVTVTATASLQSITWSLGEPAGTGGPYAPGPPVTMTCQGTGSAPPPSYDWKAEPPCGHKYTWMSAEDRTGGSGKWPITATSNWNVTWQSNTGVSGSTVLNASSSDALEIGEYRTVLVHGPGG